MEHSCKICGRPLEGAITRPLRNPPPLERVHATGDVYATREPLGHEVIGECQKHGVQRYVPMSLPRYEGDEQVYASPLRLVV